MASCRLHVEVILAFNPSEIDAATASRADLQRRCGCPSVRKKQEFGDPFSVERARRKTSFLTASICIPSCCKYLRSLDKKIAMGHQHDTCFPSLAGGICHESRREARPVIFFGLALSLMISVLGDTNSPRERSQWLSTLLRLLLVKGDGCAQGGAAAGQLCAPSAKVPSLARKSAWLGLVMLPRGKRGQVGSLFGGL